MKRFHLIAEGKVQGVYFRHYTEKLGKALELSGWVMNKPNKTVEIEVQGNEDTLEEFINKIKAGPSPESNVTSLHVEEVETIEEESDFTIK